MTPQRRKFYQVFRMNQLPNKTGNIIILSEYRNYWTAQSKTPLTLFMNEWHVMITWKMLIKRSFLGRISLIMLSHFRFSPRIVHSCEKKIEKSLAGDEKIHFRSNKFRCSNDEDIPLILRKQPPWKACSTFERSFVFQSVRIWKTCFPK